MNVARSGSKKTICFGLACVLILALAWLFLRPGAIAPLIYSTGVDPQFSASNSPIHTEIGGGAKRVESRLASKPNLALAPSDEIAVKKSVEALASLLSMSESKNVKVVQEISSENLESVFMTVAPFSSDQFQQAFALVSSETAKLSNPGAREELWLRSQKELKKYTQFPKPFKSIQVLISKHPGVSPKLLEFYSDKADRVKPDEFGLITMRFDGSLLFHDDQHFGTEGSWATDRYRNLVSLDAKK